MLIRSSAAERRRIKLPLAIFEVEVSLSSTSLPVKRALVPYRHCLLASLRAGLSAIAILVMALVITASSNSQAEAPPPPPPEVDAPQVVTKSVPHLHQST